MTLWQNSSAMTKLPHRIACTMDWGLAGSQLDPVEGLEFEWSYLGGRLSETLPGSRFTVAENRAIFGAGASPYGTGHSSTVTMTLR
jgi:hypothetical protein